MLPPPGFHIRATVETLSPIELHTMATTTQTIAVEGKALLPIPVETDTPLSGPKKPAGYDPEDPTTNLNVIPKFANKLDERKWAKEQMVAIFRVFAKQGFADGFNGHISLRG